MIDCHMDVILCMSFNTDGSLLATTCKDKKLRVVEPRSGRVLQVRCWCWGVRNNVLGRCPTENTWKHLQGSSRTPYGMLCVCRCLQIILCCGGGLVVLMMWR